MIVRSKKRYRTNKKTKQIPAILMSHFYTETIEPIIGRGVYKIIIFLRNAGLMKGANICNKCGIMVKETDTLRNKNGCTYRCYKKDSQKYYRFVLIKS